MRNNKGFTIIEIIICISLLVVIGVGSFISIRVISKKQLIDKLNMISTKASEAAQVYIETNKNASNQLYNNKNGVSLPLQLLVNEGYLSLEGTKLTNNDIKNQYVVTFLGGTGSTENCEQITSTNSWSNNQPIYLCMNSDGSGSNLATINPNTSSNRIKVSQEPYYFKGAGARNYVKYGDKLYRIYYIDTDDTLILYSTESFGNTFNGKILPISSYSVGARANGGRDFVWCNGVDNTPRIGEEYNVSSSEGEVAINDYDVIRTSYCVLSDSDTRTSVAILDAWMNYDWEYYGNSSNNGFYIDIWRNRRTPYAYKIHLNSSFKLGSGTGDYTNPYILEEK